MDKNAIKKYAIWARNELIVRVSQKAQQYGITAEGYGDKNADSVNGVLMSPTEKKQRQALIAKIDVEGFEQVMEEVAYTWFNRFTALRFMEVNNYLPSHARVFTNEENEFKPQILADAISLDLEGLDMDKVFELKDANKDEELYKYLLIVQCNALSNILPGMFQKIADYTELLLPDYLLRTGSVIERLIVDIPEDNFDLNADKGQVEIIGWLYQYYISEKHEAVVNAIGKATVAKEDIPAATQLFTPDWIVKYIVDNSVGKAWIEGNPNSHLAKELEYYLGNTAGEHRIITNPNELTVFDPCLGSGHFLVYAFDVLMKIYIEYGYSEREAAAEIVSKNLFGLDIDNRAAQLAYFSIMMKARQHDRRFFTRNIQPNLMSVEESNGIDRSLIDYFCNSKELRNELEKLLDAFYNAKEYGSLIYIPQINLDIINNRFSELREEESLFSRLLEETLFPLIKAASILNNKYTVIATNPPYLNKLDPVLKEYVNNKFKAYSGDLFSVFMYRSFDFCQDGGYSGFMTPNVWMFISTYQQLREYLIDNKSISSCVQLAKGAFFKEATVDICAFVMQNQKEVDGIYVRLENFKGDMEVQREALLGAMSATCDYRFIRDIKQFARIEGKPFAYWLSNTLTEIFETAKPLAKVAPPKQGLATADNNRFLRLWFEPQITRIGFGLSDCTEALESGLRWFPYNKGGAYRRWYGNRDYVVNWENNGKEIKSFKDENGKVRSRPQNLQYYFKPSITWSDLTSASFSGRYCEGGFIFDIKGSSGFPKKEDHYYLLGFLNSKISQECISVLNPTMSTQVGDMARIPVFADTPLKAEVEQKVKECVELSKADWDSFETSWDFEMHPFIKYVSKSNGSIKEAYSLWEKECADRFEHLKENEADINRLFIQIYGLENELVPEVEDKDVTVRKANLERDIKSFISYAVGCMFGRYSLGSKGIIFAGNDWSESYYPKFKVDRDNIIPISDDEYFENDIVVRLVEFVAITFGIDKLEENLSFISSALKGKGSSREVIRNYFITDFYSDHCNNYSVSGSGKRPIYWLFDSGKKNGFKCLIYMHRYHADTIARIRTDYVHEQQSRYRTAISDLETRMNSADSSEKIKNSKKLKSLSEQADEIRVFEEKIHHLADQMISIDLDDGVKANYAKFQDVLAKIK